MPLRSRITTDGLDRTPHRAFMRAMGLDDAAILRGIELGDQHNLNSTDGAILAACLRHSRAQPPGSPAGVLIAADRRLVRAAELEGLRAINPEVVAPADVPTLLAGF